MQRTYLKHKKKKVLETWVGRDIKKSSKPSFSIKASISSTCTFQEIYLFNLVLKSLSQWRFHHLLRQSVLVALCLQQKLFTLSNLYLPCGNLSSLLKPWTSLNPYRGSERAVYFLPLLQHLSLQWIKQSQFIQFFLLELTIPYSLLYPEDFCGCWLQRSVGIFPSKNKKQCQNTIRAAE